MRRTAIALAGLMIFACPATVLAAPQDLPFMLAKLAESLDAGVSRADLHALRIDIGAQIRLETAAGRNPLANLPVFARTLAAVDKVWGILGAATACQADKGAMRTPTECRTLIEPLYKTIGLPVPDLTGNPNPAAIVQELLQELKKQTEATLHDVQ